MSNFNGRIMGATFIRGFSQKAMENLNLIKVFEFEITFLSLKLEKLEN